MSVRLKLKTQRTRINTVRWFSVCHCRFSWCRACPLWQRTLPTRCVPLSSLIRRQPARLSYRGPPQPAPELCGSRRYSEGPGLSVVGGANRGETLGRRPKEHVDRHREGLSWLLKAVCEKAYGRQPVATAVVAVQWPGLTVYRALVGRPCLSRALIVRYQVLVTSAASDLSEEEQMTQVASASEQ